MLIVSDGIVHLLPFSALPDPRTIASDTQDADPLILEHELIHLPSASTLAFLRGNWNQPSRWPKAARVFADPIFEADDPRIHGGTLQPAVRGIDVAKRLNLSELAQAGIARRRRL